MRLGPVLVGLFVASGAVAAACEKPYVYAPTSSTGATLEGRPAAHVRIPPESPTGDVQIASFGIAGIRAGDGDDDEVRALHLRFQVSNNSVRPWTLDTREQRVSLVGGGESSAAYASSNGATPPIIEVPAGGKRQIDLFYPLPEQLEKASRLPEFDVVWKVQTDARVVAERTGFERLVVESRPDPDYYAGWGYGWGPPYWYDPWYTRGSFVGVRMGGPMSGGAAPRIEHRGDVRRASPEVAPPAGHAAPPPGEVRPR